SRGQPGRVADVDGDVVTSGRGERLADAVQAEGGGPDNEVHDAGVFQDVLGLDLRQRAADVNVAVEGPPVQGWVERTRQLELVGLLQPPFDLLGRAEQPDDIGAADA